MADFTAENLSGSRFTRVDLTDAEFHATDLSRARFRGVDLTGALMRGVDLVDVRIDGDIQNLLINGVDVAPLVNAELDRRDPDRAKMRPTDPAGFREAWEIVERRWESTVERARGLDAGLLHRSVDGEWSFVETLRHLVFATDAWVRRAMLGDPSPWDPLDLPWDEMPDTAGIPRNREVRPSLEDVLALRRDRMATVRTVIEGLTEEDLAARTEPVGGAGWPPPESFPVRKCLLIVLNEEWHHRQFAERDLDALVSDADPQNVRPQDITPDTKDWTWVLGSRCPECGFVAARIGPAEVADRLRANADDWRVVLQRPEVRARPRPGVWSPLEYGCHVRDVHRTMQGRVALMLEEEEPTFPDWDQDAAAVAARYAEQDPAVVADELAAAAASAAATYDGVSGRAWDRPGLRSNGSRFTVASLARYHLHDVVHHLHDVR